MRFTGFIGPTYSLPSVNFDCQRCVNLYPEVNEIGSGKDKEVASLRSTPGYTLLTTFDNGPHRGSWYSSTKQLYVVTYNKLYKVSNTWAKTEVGTLSTFEGRVGMADNGTDLVIVDGPNGYVHTMSGSTTSQITGDGWFGSDMVSFQDGYFIFVKPNSPELYISELNGTALDALDFFHLYGLPGNIVSHVSASHNLWMFGETTAQVFFNSGEEFPFQPVNGAHVEYGIVAKFSVAKIGGSAVWLGKDEKGGYGVFRANGYQPQKISTLALETALAGYGDLTTATAYSYQNGGHYFYVLSFPEGDTSWAFDSSTNLWHERAYTTEGLFQRHRAETHAFAYGKHVVGDWENGNLYELREDVFTDNGQEITRLRASPHISEGMKRIRYDSFQLDIEAGTGLDGIAQGTDPQIMLQWSDDGGHTWKDERWTSFGKIGATKKRAIWNRLGMSRDRVFRIKITDPVKVAILGAEMSLVRGNS